MTGFVTLNDPAEIFLLLAYYAQVDAVTEFHSFCAWGAVLATASQILARCHSRWPINSTLKLFTEFTASLYVIHYTQPAGVKAIVAQFAAQFVAQFIRKSETARDNLRRKYWYFSALTDFCRRKVGAPRRALNSVLSPIADIVPKRSGLKGDY